MRRFLSVVNQTAKGIATVVFVAGSVTFAYSYIEGYVDPVMRPLSLEDVHPVKGEAFTVRFDGVAEKLRACDWVAGMLASGLRPAFAPSGRFKGRQWFGLSER